MKLHRDLGRKRARGSTQNPGSVGRRFEVDETYIDYKQSLRSRYSAR